MLRLFIDSVLCWRNNQLEFLLSSACSCKCMAVTRFSWCMALVMAYAVCSGLCFHHIQSMCFLRAIYCNVLVFSCRFEAAGACWAYALNDGVGSFRWLVLLYCIAVDVFPHILDCTGSQLPKLLELVGLGYSAWFTYRYLLFKVLTPLLLPPTSLLSLTQPSVSVVPGFDPPMFPSLTSLIAECASRSSFVLSHEEHTNPLSSCA